MNFPIKWAYNTLLIIKMIIVIINFHIFTGLVGQ